MDGSLLWDTFLMIMIIVLLPRDAIQAVFVCPSVCLSVLCVLVNSHCQSMHSLETGSIVFI